MFLQPIGKYNLTKTLFSGISLESRQSLFSMPIALNGRGDFSAVWRIRV
jgi:hypothetical protein